MPALLKLTIEKSDGDKSTYPVLPKTIVAFERKFATGIGIIKDQQKMEHIYWLAWDSARTVGDTNKLFEDWLDEIAEVEVDSDTAPLGAGRSQAS